MVSSEGDHLVATHMGLAKMGGALPWREIETRLLFGGRLLELRGNIVLLMMHGGWGDSPLVRG